jgi:hypothetical protein
MSAYRCWPLCCRRPEAPDLESVRMIARLGTYDTYIHKLLSLCPTRGCGLYWWDANVGSSTHANVGLLPPLPLDNDVSKEAGVADSAVAALAAI